MKKEKSQTYTPELRESSVKLALDSGLSIKQIAVGLGIKPSTLHTWIKGHHGGDRKVKGLKINIS